MEKFVAVVVNNGRKFRGEAYDIGSEVHVSNFNVFGTWGGVAGWRSCENIKLWSPTKGFVWCNPKYIEEREVAPEVEQADYAKFVEYTFDDTMKFCRSRSVGKPESEIVRFARCCIRKHHPEMLPLFDAKYNFKEDIAAVVEGTLEWAFNLPYSNAKRVRLALRALSKKGYANNPEIIPMWTMWLDLRGLSRLVKKYLPEEIQSQCI